MVWELLCTPRSGAASGTCMGSMATLCVDLRLRLQIDEKPSLGFPQDRPCWPIRKGDRCGLYFLAYHKTGNWLLRFLRSSLAKVLLGSSAGIHSPLLSAKWNAAPGRHLAPIAEVPADYATIDQPAPETMSGVMHKEELWNWTPPDGWDMLQRPISPIVVTMGEFIPPLHFIRGLISRSKRPYPLPSLYRGRVVHLIRDPAELAASAFRFHSRRALRENPHFAAFHGLGCHGCSHTVWHDLFRRCGYRCGYLTLLQKIGNASVPEALELEYGRSHSSIQAMLRNTELLSNDSRVLHLSPEHFRQPHVAQTLRCMAHFILGHGHGDALVAPADILDSLTKEMVKDSQLWLAKTHHATFKDRKDWKLDFRKHLLSHPSWGPSLSKTSVFFRGIFEHQSELFKCPVPSFY
ncbi:unnamed protein product [Durusdinium trenchii]|uniref:Sulfotransferase domain-containing protein n=1 Tax=Durusdinium trenchii TaxID=1381693 RepID=A0ABP0P4U9_9DINO